tara:strand:+ start:1590 stop:1991 length:402 start_codon:yes stop_codon:yes gene_type:complete
MKLLLLLLVFSPAVNAVPVVPNFQTGSMTSHTETKSTVKETIVSESYGTGWEYTVSGTNVQPANGASLTPGTTTVKEWSSLDVTKKPKWQLTTPGQSFQFVETYSGPGLSNITTIQRVTEIEQITDTISTFSQ